MLAQRCSSSAVRGQASLSIIFLSNISAMSCSACRSIRVVTNVANFSIAIEHELVAHELIGHVDCHLLVGEGVARGTSRLSDTRMRMIPLGDPDHRGAGSVPGGR
jgi:hypothetical protein